MPQNVFALLVGINNYHPESGVSPLNGCINDTKAIEQLLVKKHQTPKQQIVTLHDKKATRQGVIETFQRHLCDNKKIGPGDTVLFFYSGHGSYARTAAEFTQFDAEAQDETIVCYDSRLKDKYDLADKEIAVLLSRIRQDANIAVIIDACHSGSITRSLADDGKLARPRFTGSRQDGRALDSYLLDGDDFYPRMLRETGKITIPESTHLVLSACDRKQEAWEMAINRGLFSYTLLNVLEKAHRGISYEEAFTRARAYIEKFAEGQTPKIQVFKNFDHNKTFLGNEVTGGKERHLIKFIDGGWRMEYGAIHGLPTEADEFDKIQVAVYPDEADRKAAPMKVVGVDAVKLKETVLDFQHDEEEDTFQAEIVSMPPNLNVYLKGTKRERDKFRSLFRKNPSPFLFFNDHPEGAKYELRISGGQLLVHLREEGSLIHGVESFNEASVQYITGILEQVEKWERIARLDNRDSRFKADDIELSFFEESTQGKPVECAGDTITLDFTGKPIFYQIKAKSNVDENLYISLVHLSRKFGLEVYYPCQQIKKSAGWITLDNQHGMFVPDEETEVTDVFKLVVSTKEFDDYKFNEKDLPLGQVHGAIKKKDVLLRDTLRRTAEDDWFTKSLTVRLIRQADSIGQRDAKLKQSNIVIKGHEQFRANISFGSLNPYTKNVSPVSALSKAFRDGGFELLDFAPKTRSAGSLAHDESVIELSDIQNEESLKEKPLEILIQQKLAEAEHLVPVTFDGEHIIPFGDAQKDAGGNTLISIRELPTVPDTQRQEKKKSPGKALWFCLLKFAGLREHAFRLRHASFDEEGEVKRSSRQLQKKVDAADKILLVVHGIIGDTKPFLQELKFVYDENRYGLILGYDYENLNEPIEKIAEELDKRLAKVGLKAGHKKQLDIIAHSMGGLVSRYLIENIRKDDGSISRLLMFGTPNGGSAFGNIPQYRDMMVTFMTLSLNYFKAFLGPVYVYLETFNRVLEATVPLTKTLAQMKVESDFLKQLEGNESPQSTTYIIAAGDIHQYQSKATKSVARLVDKALNGVANLAYSTEPNDIAVSVPQIKAVKAVEVFDLACHHLNYFQHEDGQKVLKQLL